MKHAGYMIAAIAFLFGAPNGIPAAQAETIQLKADLKGANEIPPNASPASGKAVATLDTQTKLLTWTVTYADLTGPLSVLTFMVPANLARTLVSRCRSRRCKVRSKERQRLRRTRRPTCSRVNGTQTFTPPPILGASFAAK